MIQFKKNGLRVLKLFHMIAACCWLGGAFAMLVVNLHFSAADNGGMLYGIVSAGHAVDIWVVILSGLGGCVITGLVYGIFTSWGFFRHKWVIVKWIGTFAGFFFGNRFLGIWGRKLLEMSKEMGMDALQDPIFLQTQMLQRYGSIAQSALLIFLIGISIIKPWRKKNS